MKLFDDTMLFDEGKKRFTDFRLPDADLRLWEQFIEKKGSGYYFKTLLESSLWKQRTRKMYEKLIPEPRLTAWYSTENIHVWSPALLQIKDRVESECGIVFNSVLLNYYRDGNDSVAWHSDTLPADGKHHAIASVTFGDTRVFKVRHKRDKEECCDIPLTHGSLLLMGEQMQQFYEHHVPKTKKPVGPRINLTFRIADFITKKSYA